MTKVDDFNEPRFDFEESMEDEDSYQSRRDRFDQGPGKKRWVLPLVLLLILAAGLSAFWYMGGFSRLMGAFFAPGEQTVMITMPETLFTDSHNEEAMTSAVAEEGTEQTARDEEGNLTYMMSPAARESLLGEAKDNLEEKIAALEDARQHPYVVDITYDSAYRDFYLVVDREQEQYEQALVTASELFMRAAFYQHINSGADPAGEILITLEVAGSGEILEQVVYPGDLSRMAEVMVTAEAPVEAPPTPQPGDRVIVATGPDNLNLRNGPQITYLIIDILRSGTILEVTGTDGVWLEVITPEGKEGWVHGDFVEIYPEEEEEPD